MSDTLTETEQETTVDFGDIDTLVMESDGDIETLLMIGREFIITHGITQLTPWAVQPGPGRYRKHQIRCEAVKRV